MTTNAELRDRRKRLLDNMLEEMKGTPIDLILAQFSTRQHVSLRKAKEYLEELRLLHVNREIPLSYAEST